MFTVSYQHIVYCILNNWCICINISCGIDDTGVCEESTPPDKRALGSNYLELVSIYRKVQVYIYIYIYMYICIIICVT